MPKVCDSANAEKVKKQLLITISEILNEKGLISNDEKNRMKVIVNNRRGANKCVGDSGGGE